MRFMLIYLINIILNYHFSIYSQVRGSTCTCLLDADCATADDKMLKPITFIIGIFYLGELRIRSFFFFFYTIHLHY